MSVPFRERNPVIVGAVSLAVIAALVLAAFRAEDLPLIGGGDTYYAAFSEAGGLKANDEVRIAGVRVGKVKSVDLDGDHVRVEFLVDRGVDFGSTTAAAIKVKTLLGAMYLSLQPDGGGQLAEGSEIPRQRTSSPYDVVDAFAGPGRPVRADRHRPARPVAQHRRRADREHPGGVPGGAAGGLGPLRQHRRARRAAQHPAGQPAQGVRRARRPSPGPGGADARRRQAVPGAGGPPPGGQRPARLHQRAVGPADRRSSATPAPTSSRPSTTSTASSTC